MSEEGSFCNLYIVNTPKEQNAGVSMVQKRSQPAWKTGNQRKRSQKIASQKRRVIAYTVRGIMAAVFWGVRLPGSPAVKFFKWE